MDSEELRSLAEIEYEYSITNLKVTKASSMKHTTRPSWTAESSNQVMPLSSGDFKIVKIIKISFNNTGLENEYSERRNI